MFYVSSTKYKHNFFDKCDSNNLSKSTENISCHSQNCIYLLTCKNCDIQYVGETALSLHWWINIAKPSLVTSTWLNILEMALPDNLLSSKF